MKTEFKNNILYTEDISDFNIQQTMECGQCFHYEKLSEMEYGIVHKDQFLHVKQEKNQLICYNINPQEWHEIWCPYFDLNRDYHKIKEYLISRDNRLKEAIKENDGIRILRQDFTEILMSFIISQNKKIPHIKAIVKTISEKYGTKLDKIGEKEFYSFPNKEILKHITVDEFRDCKTGFRAPYLYDAAQKIAENEFCYDRLRQCSYVEAKEQLMQIKGVGEKVANCVLLFSLNYRNAFPVDVWIKRIMESMYFEKETSPKAIMEFSKNKFGEYGGYAQQYLFYYAKEHEIKK